MSDRKPGGQHAAQPFDVDDPSLDQFDLVREGARRDGVEIVYYQPRFPVPGTPREKRVERLIAGLLLLAGLSALAFTVLYVVWPWRYQQGPGPDKLYTPLLGLTMALAFFGVGAAVVVWAKKLLPEEIAVQDRHDGASDSDERKLTGATLVNLVDETGIRRRPLLKRALLTGLAPMGVMAVVPLGALVRDPGRTLRVTAWAPGVRLVRRDGTPVRTTDIEPGGVETVFPGIPEGTSNKYADAPTLLFHLPAEDAARVRPAKGYENANHGNFYAYSKICTHAGCPASLYEQRTKRLLCPCHQSQFDVLDACKPIFGPATRRLPQLPITVETVGGIDYFVAKSDYLEPVGPAFWELP